MQADFEDLPALRQEYRDSQIVFRGGCFDLLHEGHVEALEFAKRHGDLLFVGISSDERVKQRKGPCRPIVSELSRLAVVDAVRFVDVSFVMPMPAGSVSPTMQVIRSLHPSTFIDNSDNIINWSPEELEKMEALGTQVIIDPHRDYHVSTSGIIDKIIQTSGV
jgi:cytidyltransferase-like protein